MNDISPIPSPGLPPLSGITFRQLRIFRVVYHEKSFTHAAVELRSTRTNVKRVCAEFEKTIGRKLFEESADHTLQPTPFAHGLASQTGHLHRCLRRLNEGVRAMHEEGRTLRFAAAGGFFRGSVFTNFLSRLEISDRFKACFLRIEAKRFRSALLNAECDVYFGSALTASDRLDSIDLGSIPWKILHNGSAPPDHPQGLDGRWYLVETGDPEAANSILENFRALGAKGGSFISEDEASEYAAGKRRVGKHAYIFMPDHSSKLVAPSDTDWPSYRLSAVVRRNHPYTELKQRLIAAAGGTDGC